MSRKHLRRALRNIGLAALAGLVIWCIKGFPLPTPEMDFRRDERQALAERSEIIWTYEGTMRGDEDLLVGLSDTAVHVWHPNGYVLFWPRQEGGTLVPLPAETLYQDQANSYLGPALLVPDPPAGAADARLTITLRENEWSETYAVKGQPQGQVFFFQLEMRYRGDAENDYYESNAFRWLAYERPESSGFRQYPYTLEFFDASGNPLSTIHQEGWLAEEDA